MRPIINDHEDDNGRYVTYTDHAAELANRDAEIEIYKELAVQHDAEIADFEQKLNTKSALAASLTDELRDAMDQIAALEARRGQLSFGYEEQLKRAERAESQRDALVVAAKDVLVAVSLTSHPLKFKFASERGFTGSGDRILCQVHVWMNQAWAKLRAAIQSQENTDER